MAGNFRATFEDKILMSDIVFCRAWVPVEPKKLYNPIASLLAPAGDEESLAVMKTVAELRREKNVPIPVNSDSVYKPIERQTRRFNPLRIPQRLQERLPFASKPKMDKKGTGRQESLILSREEKKTYTLMQQLNTVRNQKVKARREKQRERVKKHLKKKAKDSEQFAVKGREEKKRKYRAMGLAARAKKGKY